MNVFLWLMYRFCSSVLLRRMGLILERERPCSITSSRASWGLLMCLDFSWLSWSWTPHQRLLSFCFIRWCISLPRSRKVQLMSISIAGSWRVQWAERGLAGWSSSSSTMLERSHTAPKVSALGAEVTATQAPLCPLKKCCMSTWDVSWPHMQACHLKRL